MLIDVFSKGMLGSEAEKVLGDAAITVNKNVWGYGFSKFITPWVMESGFVKPIMLNMSLTALWCLCAIPFYFWGKKLRGLTAKSSVHKM